MTKGIKRPGAGRTKGAVSLISVKMKDLKGRFNDEDIVVVGRVFAQKSGIAAVAPAVSAPAPEGLVVTV